MERLNLMTLNDVTDVAETLSEIDSTWILIGKVLALLTVIIGLYKAVEYLWSKSPSYKLGTRLETAEKRLEAGDKHFAELDQRIKSIEEQVGETQKQINEVNEGIKMLGKAEVSLFNHFINGNGVDQMKKEVKDLTDYFIDR